MRDTFSTAAFAISAMVVALAFASDAVPPHISGARAITISVMSERASSFVNFENLAGAMYGAIQPKGSISRSGKNDFETNALAFAAVAKWPFAEPHESQKSPVIRAMVGGRFGPPASDRDSAKACAFGAMETELPGDSEKRNGCPAVCIEAENCSKSREPRP